MKGETKVNDRRVGCKYVIKVLLATSLIITPAISTAQVGQDLQGLVARQQDLQAKEQVRVKRMEATVSIMKRIVDEFQRAGLKLEIKHQSHPKFYTSGFKYCLEQSCVTFMIKVVDSKWQGGLAYPDLSSYFGLYQYDGREQVTMMGFDDGVPSRYDDYEGIRRKMVLVLRQALDAK